MGAKADRRLAKAHTSGQRGAAGVARDDRQNTVSIRERPAEAGDRAVTGHWEGDLLFGSNSSQIATLVERHTRYVLLVSVPSKDTRTVINALIKQANYRENPRSR